MSLSTKQHRSRRILSALCGAAAVLVLSAALFADDSAAPQDANQQPAPEQMNAWKLYRKGGPFMYPLTLCSILSVAIIIERFIALRRSAVVPRDFLPGLKAVFRDPSDDRDAALNYCRNHDSPIARMVAAGVKRVPRGWVAVEKGIEDAGANEALKLRRNMRFLYAMGSVATLLGLIGTIAGMITAFQSAASSGAKDVQRLSEGIYLAMVNTFAGLAVAIVVTVFYYFFVGRIERLISEINDTLSAFSDEYGLNVNAESEAELRVANTL